MTEDLQKASFWKRISAFMLDAILLVILAVGCGAALSGVLGFERHNETVQTAYTRYETDYNISFEMTQEEYETMLPEDRARFDQAYAALIADEEAMMTWVSKMDFEALLENLEEAGIPSEMIQMLVQMMQGGMGGVPETDYEYDY